MSQRQRDWVWLASIGGTLLLALLPYSGYIASLPLIKLEWEISNAQSGIVFSSFLIGSALSSLLLIPLADKISPNRMMATSLFIAGIANLLFPVLAQGFWSATLLRFVAGAGQVVTYVLGIQVVSKRFDLKRRGTAVGFFVGLGYAGTTISYTLFGLILDQFSTWRSAFIVVSTVSLIGISLMLWIAMRSSLSAGEMLERHVEDVVELPEAPAGKGRLQLTALRSRPIRLVILAYALHAAELYLARLWFPLLLGATLMQDGRSAAETAAPAATLSGLMFMTGIIGVFGGGALSDRIGRTRGAAIIFAFSGACSLVAGWLVGAPPIYMIVLGFIYGLTTAADSAIYSTAAVELSPPNLIGSVQAAQSFIGFGVGAIVPVIAGVILDLTPSAYRWGFAFSFNALLAILGLFVLLRVQKLMRQRQPVDWQGS